MKNLKQLSQQHVDSLPKLRAPAGYVYVIQEMKFGDEFKIGRTNYLARRVSQFGVQLPFPIKVILIKRAYDASAAEKHLHRKYRKLRGVGEWFRLSESDISAIEKWDASKIRREKPETKERQSPRRTVAKRDPGLSEEDWLDDDSAMDRDIDYDGWDYDEASARDSETADSDVYLPEGDIEDVIAFENLTGKDLAGVILNGHDLSNRDLSLANLWGAELSHTYLVASDLTAVDFTDAEMQDADLSYANLMKSNLTGVNLRRARMVNANLQGANLTAAELSKAVLSGATYDEFTILPNGNLWSARTDMTQFTT